MQAETYEEARENLAAYADVRESEERGRSHYRVRVSFERDVEPGRIQAMAKEWLKETFPKARAAVFVHSDTGHRHAHIWIEARQTDGRKIDLSPRQFRQLDEKWNRLYSKEMGRPEREHLDKKAETFTYKRAVARGEKTRKPERAVRVYEPEQSRVRENGRDASRGAASGDRPEQGAGRDHTAAQNLADASHRAVSEADRLRADFAALGERVHGPELERER